jgi:ectoine hydroxylase-related dioxygenase (phytanoyl-CoA dioxygenase family)
MNRHPLNPITPDDIETYRADGVVCLRNMLDQEWIARMQAAAARVIADPAGHGNLGPSHGKMTSVAFIARRDPDFRDFAALSPIAEIVGTVIGSNAIRMFHDHLFAKPPLSPSIMQWHCDHTAWPVTGEMVPNVWTALSPVNAENGRVEYLAGWHRHCVEHGIRYGFVPGQEHGVCPDFERERSNPDFPFRFVTFDMNPGDCVVFHPFTPHFSKGNRSSDTPRIGLALRVFGDDIVWSPDDYKMRIPDYPDPPRGAAPDGPVFPVLWRRDAAAPVP